MLKIHKPVTIHSLRIWAGSIIKELFTAIYIYLKCSCNNHKFFYATAYYYNAPKWQKIKFFIHIFSPHTLINFSYIQKSCSNRYSPVVAAELSLLHVTVLDSGFATLCFHKCALMVNNFIEFAHFCQYIFLDKMLNCQLQHHFCKFCFIYC